MIVKELRNAFRCVGLKRVTQNEKNKGCYIPTVEQVAVLRDAGFNPVHSSRRQTIPIRVAGTDEVLRASYYSAQRRGSRRRPEPRLGRELMEWVEARDLILLGSDGDNVFVRKVPDVDEAPYQSVESSDVVRKVYAQFALKRLHERALGRVF